MALKREGRRQVAASFFLFRKVVSLTDTAVAVFISVVKHGAAVAGAIVMVAIVESPASRSTTVGQLPSSRAASVASIDGPVPIAPIALVLVEISIRPHA